MPPPPAMKREPVGAVPVAVLAITGALLAFLHRLLTAGYKRRQSVYVALAVGSALRHARLVGLLLRLKGLRVPRKIRLWLARAVSRLAHGAGACCSLPLVLALIEALVSRALHIGLGAREVRIILPELFLRRGDDAVIVLGMLIVVFSGNRVA